MTARRRSRRGRQHPVLLAAGLALAVVVGLDVLHALGWLLVTAGLAAGAYAIGRNRRPVIRATAARAEAPELARLRAERDQLAEQANDLRRQVAKLEDDAARNDDVLCQLEDAAGRPVEAILASYRHVQRQYGPAAVGKRSQRTG